MNLKFLFTILSAFIATSALSQYSVDPWHLGRAKKFEDGVFQHFKTTTTIFVLPEVIEIEVYNTILEEVWTATPYKIVPYTEFNMLDYADSKHSIAEVRLASVSDTKAIYTLDFYSFKEGAAKKLKKVEHKSYGRRNVAFLKNVNQVARVPLFENQKLVDRLWELDKQKKWTAKVQRKLLYTTDSFYNLQPGLFKNYLQQINESITNEQNNWLYESSEAQQVSELRTETLYIPTYVVEDHNRLISAGFGKNMSTFEETFTSYKHVHKIINNADINAKILAGESFYYLRFLRLNSQKFIVIVDAKTGKEIYRNYILGANSKMHMQARQIEKMSDAIAK